MIVHLLISGVMLVLIIIIMIITDANCCNILGTFLAIESGEHISKPIVEYIKVRALRLQPRSARSCELNVDGERVGSNAMELRVFRGILNFICR
jgi:diacylglycerol kinase family enzyme